MVELTSTPSQRWTQRISREHTIFNTATTGSKFDSCPSGDVKYIWMSAVAKFEMVPFNPPFFYAKYVQWMISTNITLYLLIRSVAKANKRITFRVMACNSLMILSGLCAASMRVDEISTLDAPRYITSRWIYWVFGMMFYILLLTTLNNGVRLAANSRQTHAERGKVFNELFFIICVGWSLYPFVWVVTEGAYIVTFTTNVYSFTLLDVVTKFSFAAVFLIRIPKRKHQKLRHPATEKIQQLRNFFSRRHHTADNADPRDSYRT
ncbi:hypothetical protein GUITHDRAFT_151284 [Guillardia theta CCMP2712]|uniref:Opsin n=1 Tax=Guillardia theta (strain CCMP2712) TaxID=905079 RepID=L1JQI7_GUITC|nr:hypothetical protein GUITHDRAFT_151284 [Guillardia theta CCMP2712]EKX50343.1 hypothetical protein GUITHDRAFT_151284 [Guillardia theta CCMP2712]|eukprot:XP_005837323.1 hypothetical protein GUITHDRAFT_151284 [Guillardia theta CCMP2712]